MQLEAVLGSNCQRNLDGCKFGHRSEGLVVIDAALLREPLCHKARFVALEFTGLILLHAENQRKPMTMQRLVVVPCIMLHSELQALFHLRASLVFVADT